LVKVFFVIMSIILLIRIIDHIYVLIARTYSKGAHKLKIEDWIYKTIILNEVRNLIGKENDCHCALSRAMATLKNH